MASEAGGAIFAADGRPGPIVYFGVDDLDAEVARVRELGGEAGDKQEIPDIGLYAYCVDTEGNPFSLFQGAAG